MADPGQPAAQQTQPESEQAGAADVQLPALDDLPVELEVRMGSVTLPVEDLLQLQPGSILTIDGPAGEPVALLAGGKPVACGEIVAVGDHLAVRVLEIVDADADGED